MSANEKRSLHIQVSKELGEQLDALRGDVPMQRFVVRRLEEVVKAAAKRQRFYGAAVREEREGSLVVAVDKQHAFNDAASRDAWVAEFPEGRRAL